MSVIGDEYDNFQREGFHNRHQPKCARIPSFDNIEEGDYVMVSQDVPGSNLYIDNYYLIQKKISKATLIIFYNGRNIKIRYWPKNDNEWLYHLTSPVINYGILQIVKFEHEMEHYAWLQILHNNEIHNNEIGT